VKKLVALAVLMMAGASAVAHHSFAMFDLDREATLAGTVKAFHFTNPHVWLEIIVPDGNGSSTEWSLEMGAPGMLIRTGWKSRMLTPGDAVTVIVNPLKTGGPRGRVVKVTLPDGRVMGPGGVPPIAPAPPAR
jgi:hypothetical protein